MKLGKLAVVTLLTLLSLNGDDIYEENDNFYNAKEIGIGEYELYAGDDDYFKFYLKVGTLTLKMEPLEDKDLNMILYNSNGDIIKTNFQPNIEEIYFNVLTEGNYYIKIYPTAPTNNSSYRLTFNKTEITDDNYEENDDFSSAKEIGTGVYHLFAGDNDYFKFHLKPGTLNLKMEPSDGKDINMELYNSNGDVIKTNFQPGIEEINFEVLLEGDYYLKIYPSSPLNYAPYKLTFNKTEIIITEDSYESNNDFDNAKELKEGVYNLYGGDDDYFKLSLNPGSLLLRLEPENGKDLNMELYNDKKEVIGGNFQPGIEEISTHIITKGDYYVKIYPTSPLNYTNYKLTFKTTIETTEDDEYEENDNIETAKLISSNSNLRDLVLKDDDFFKVKLYPGTFHIEALGVGTVELFDSNFTKIDDSIHRGVTIWDTEILKAGYYYIGVSGLSDEYNLTTSSASGDSGWIKELDFGPIRDVPVTLFDIDQDGEDEIFVATSKTLDADMNEIRPAGLICLEANGTIKWSRTFPAIDGADPQTGKVYKTTSVSTPPVFSDIDGDAKIDIVIGVGGDTYSEAGPDVVGQPGDKGGIYALDRDGNIKWFHQSLDIIGGTSNTGDGRPDGVYGKPVVFDINNDRKREIIYNSWDQNNWVLNAKDGKEIRGTPLLDTIWSSPAIADLNKDGTFEILVTADITKNSDAGVETGGVFHVLSPDGNQTSVGFDSFLGNPNYTTLKGKFEEQVLWSSPVVADLDNDGYLEIIYGTGNFFKDTRGSYVRVWNHDGVNRFQLSTVGRTFATPLVADINSDGKLEIVETTLDGYLFAWDNEGHQLFATQTQTFNGLGNPPVVGPIFSSPIAVDLTGDGKLEIIYSQGAQIVVVNSEGKQINDFNNASYIMKEYKGTPAIKDIDNDGVLDIISGGTNNEKDRAVVYRWQNSFNKGITTEFKNGRYQISHSYTNVENFVKRFYKVVLGREGDIPGIQYWTDALVTATEGGDSVAKGFIFSEEFKAKGLNDEEYIKTLYRAFFNREADSAGFNNWLSQLKNGEVTRAQILNGFLYSTEFNMLCTSYGIIPVK